MTGLLAKLPVYRKALAAFLAAAVAEGTALLTLNVLSGTLAHDIGVGIAAAGPILVLLGTAKAPANAPAPGPLDEAAAQTAALALVPPVNP